MSEYDELVRGLRERAERAAQEGNMTATCDARYFTQAADAIEALVTRAEKAEAEVERLKGVLSKIEQGDYPRDGRNYYNSRLLPSKHDTCVHSKAYWEDCGNCCSLFARSALEAKP